MVRIIVDGTSWSVIYIGEVGPEGDPRLLAWASRWVQVPLIRTGNRG